MRKRYIFHLRLALVAIAAILLTTCQAAKTGSKYSLTDLGTLGGKESLALGINDLGEVVGRSLTSDGKKHSFIWDRINGMQDLDPDANFNVNAHKINNKGQVVGVARTSESMKERLGFLWDRDRGIKYWPAYKVLDINDKGQMVGAYSYGRTSLWNSPEEVLKIGSLGFHFGEARRINNAGQVVGWSNSCQKIPCSDRAFLWDSKNGMRDLGTLGVGYISRAYGINDLGEVVGLSYMRYDLRSRVRAFLWDSQNGMQNLGSLDDDKKSYAKDINNAGQVVGSVEKSSFIEGFGFLWDKTNRMQDLNDLIDPDPDWKLARAEGINESGWIVGTGFFHENKRAFLLTPLSPSPTVSKPKVFLGMLAVLGICWPRV